MSWARYVKCQWVDCPQPDLHSWIPSRHNTCVVVRLTMKTIVCVSKYLTRLHASFSAVWLSICKKVINRSTALPCSKYRTITVNWPTWLKSGVELMETEKYFESFSSDTITARTLSAMSSINSSTIVDEMHDCLPRPLLPVFLMPCQKRVELRDYIRHYQKVSIMYRTKQVVITSKLHSSLSEDNCNCIPRWARNLTTATTRQYRLSSCTCSSRPWSTRYYGRRWPEGRGPGPGEGKGEGEAHFQCSVEHLLMFIAMWI